MRKILNLLPLICLILVVSCKKNNLTTSAQKIVTEWVGRKITIPDVNSTYMGTDTIMEKKHMPYRILIYTDSTGCVSCKLRLSTWKYYMHEIDSLSPGQVDFLFYFQPKSSKDLTNLLRINSFEHPVYVDQQGEINRINNFPSKIEYQCFLLDSQDRVLLIGNPTLNPKMWELYKQMLTERDDEKSIETTVEIECREIELKDLKTDIISNAAFVIKNTGSKPLLISHVDASCGCTVPHWESRPIKPEEKTEIKIEVKPDNSGYFNKSIYVYTNTNEKVIPLRIKGRAE